MGGRPKICRILALALLLTACGEERPGGEEGMRRPAGHAAMVPDAWVRHQPSTLGSVLHEIKFEGLRGPLRIALGPSGEMAISDPKSHQVHVLHRAESRHELRNLWLVEVLRHSTQENRLGVVHLVGAPGRRRRGRRLGWTRRLIQRRNLALVRVLVRLDLHRVLAPGV